MKRIFRDDKDAKLAGICSGIGQMFNFDPTIVRLAAVFICVATGFAPLIVAYIVGWFLIPTKAELEARGENTFKP
jgi:phage shock protein PspC (stress-responsive transcriptional regulator)